MALRHQSMSATACLALRFGTTVGISAASNIVLPSRIVSQYGPHYVYVNDIMIFIPARNIIPVVCDGS